MNTPTRRGFLQAFVAAAAGALALEIDPERVLWVPGAKTFFLPAENRMTVEAATDADMLRMSRERFNAAVEADKGLARERRVDIQFLTAGYWVTTGGRTGFDETVRFDKDWTPTQGWKPNGAPMTDRERVLAAQRIFGRTT